MRVLERKMIAGAQIRTLLIGVVLGRSGATDWDAYNGRDDACRAKQQLLTECVRGIEHCDELGLRIVTRECSPPFRVQHPLDEKR